MDENYTPPEPIVLEDGTVEYPEGDFPVTPLEEQDLIPVEIDEDDYSPNDEGDDLDG